MLTPHLQAELLDHVVDFLHDENDALKSCCLVSNSWIPRARKHLFARVSFHTVAHLQSWRETFRDPLASPAYYTKSLLINCPYAFSGINTEGCRWISTFCHAVEFEVDAREVNIDEPSAIPIVMFHGFSPNSPLQSKFSPRLSLPFQRHESSTSSIRFPFSKISCWWLTDPVATIIMGSQPPRNPQTLPHLQGH